MPQDYQKGPVALMARSGARGDMDQMVQLGGVRGVLTDMAMRPLEMPVWENFREGIGPLGFYLGSHGARRSICEKKLKTAPAGELTRLMVETGYECVVRMDDCKTKKGVSLRPFPPTEREPFKGLPGLARRLVGRVETATGQVIDEERARALEKEGKPVLVRSPLACEAHTTHGPGALCRKCCGWDLSKRHPAEKGLPAGILAGQSIGERGTQLTMRTFHTGGVGGNAITSGLERVRGLLSNRNIAVPSYRIIRPGNSSFNPGDEPDAWSFLLGCAGLEESGLPDWEPVELPSGQRPEMRRASEYLGEMDDFCAIFAYEFHAIYKGAVDERHLETILRGMLRWTDKGKPYLTGVYRAPLEKEGFLAGASFRRGLEVLVQAALEGKTDRMLGYKERLIAGKLV